MNVEEGTAADQMNNVKIFLDRIVVIKYQFVHQATSGSVADVKVKTIFMTKK